MVAVLANGLPGGGDGAAQDEAVGHAAVVHGPVLQVQEGSRDDGPAGEGGSATKVKLRVTAVPGATAPNTCGAPGEVTPAPGGSPPGWWWGPCLVFRDREAHGHALVGVDGAVGRRAELLHQRRAVGAETGRRDVHRAALGADLPLDGHRHRPDERSGRGVGVGDRLTRGRGEPSPKSQVKTGVSEQLRVATVPVKETGRGTLPPREAVAPQERIWQAPAGMQHEGFTSWKLRLQPPDTFPTSPPASS